MKQKFWMLICLLVLGMSAVAKDYKHTTVPGDMMQTRIYTLDNGLTVYLSVNKDEPRIQANIAIRTGSRNDPSETTGLAHYLEHLMFKGTQTFGTINYPAEKVFLDQIEAKYEVYRKLTDPAARKQAYHEIDSLSQLAARYFIPNEYDKLMSAIGSEGTNAYTSNDVTCYVENIPSNEVENWARIQADRFQNMVIRGFHTELESVYEEKNIGMAQDNRKMWEATYAKLFPTHPYGTQTTIGTQDHLKNPSITNIKNYFNRYYVPNNAAICMAGDFNPDEVIAIIDKYFGSWKRNENLSRPEFAPMKPFTAVSDTTVVGKEAEQLMMGWRFNAANQGQLDTLEVIGNMLANGKAGLFEINLEQKMKAQAVGAFAEGMTDYSMFIISGKPVEGQSLEDLRVLILDELVKFKRGEFSDDLLPSVVNNLKRDWFKGMQSNRTRVSFMVDAFINRISWEYMAGSLERISKLTKQDVVAFANRHFGNNFICVYKKTGEDTTQKKIEKPAITPIPTNRDLTSDFLTEIKNTKVAPIQPKFMDFKNDLTVTKTAKGLPLLYKKNTEDGLFTLRFMYDFGTENYREMGTASDYLEYVGTKNKSLEQIKQAFYKLACDYNIYVGNNTASITLSGLSENMVPALNLLEDYLYNAQNDDESFGRYLELLNKARQDRKKNQRDNFSRLKTYAEQGTFNPFLNSMSIDEVKTMGGQALLDHLKLFGQLKHTVMYYGNMSEAELGKVLNKGHKVSKKLADPVQAKEYKDQIADKNEVFIAPYEAKNIYMVQYINQGMPWNVSDYPMIQMFNAYFGGGMNSIVFQELREARGLAYSAGASYVQPWRQNTTQYFETYIVSQNDKMMDCVNVFNDIITNMPQSQQAFDIAKQSLQKSLETQRTLRFNILSAYYSMKKLGLESDIDEMIYRALPAINLSDLLQFGKQRLVEKPFRYIILGDEKELDMKSLEKLGPIHRLTTEQIFGY